MYSYRIRQNHATVAPDSLVFIIETVREDTFRLNVWRSVQCQDLITQDS